MPTLYAVLIWFLPVVVAIAMVEGLVRGFWLRQAYDWRAAFASLADVLARQFVVHAVLPLGLAGVAVDWAWSHRLATLPLEGWAAFLLLFLGQEFCYYWFHRASHRVRWFWATHAVHHSPNQLNFSAAYRFGLTGRLSGTMLFFVPLVWLGFPPGAVFAALSLNLLYQFWLHTDWVPKLGPLEYVLNTPSHHRVHHAANLEYLDANYGGVLIVFDRLFGTLIEERDDLPCRFGLVKPLTSNNPLRIAFHEWNALGRDLYGARSLRAVVGHLFGPPGWRADGQGLTTENLRRRATMALPAE